MPQYLAPGVYVEEVPSAIKPIAGVGTSTAGFIGVVDDDVLMPEKPSAGRATNGNGSAPPARYTVAEAGAPQLITSWESFKSAFGDIQRGNLALAQAVYGFFNNGGTRCWVARIAAPAAQAEPAAEGGSAATDQAASSRAKRSQAGSQPQAAAAAVAVATQTEADPRLRGTPEQAAAAVASISRVAAADLRQALEAFEAIDEIALVAVPGASADDARKEIVAHCQKPSLQDRFAILDAPLEPSELTSAAIKGQAGTSSYAALYYPWIRVSDPFSRAPLAVPPSGHIAGIYARVDASRGVYKAPANEAILGAVGTARPVSRADQEGLNPDGVNVIRSFGGSVTVWGARTLASGSGDSEFQYVSVRRLFLFMRESIEQGTQWVVFEPNAPPLWAKIRRNVTAFLTTLWNDGALFGNTPAEAFYVRCDETTNPIEVRELGQVVTEMGVAVVRPAEFVVFRVSQWAGPGA
jgi:phage tail sheath protein FI